MCLARSTPHTGSSGAQGLWSEFTAKPQLAAPKGSTGPVIDQGQVCSPGAPVSFAGRSEFGQLHSPRAGQYRVCRWYYI